MYSIRCILGAVFAAALTCVAADAAVFTGGGSEVNPNPEYDTYVGQNASGSYDTWEITLPNNDYKVTIACGDPSAATGPHYVALSGDGSTYSQIAALNTATDENEFATATNVPVTVSAGKLSLRLGGNSQANRINFIIISESNLPVSTTAASTSYSRNQSQDWWYYQSYNSSTATYTPLVNTSNNRWSVDGGTGGASYPQVWINGGFPGFNGLWAVRTWKAPLDATNGPVKIEGWVTKSLVDNGDGVRILLVKNGDIGSPLYERTIAWNDSAYYSFNLSTSIVAGDEIHLMLDPLSNAFSDACQLNAIVYDTTRGTTESLSGNYSRDQGGDMHITYESYNSSTGVYTQLVNTSNNRWSVDGGTGGASYPQVWINGGYPGFNGLDAVRTWLAPTTGTVDVTGTVTKSLVTGGDGVMVMLVKDDAYSSPLWQQTIAWNDASYYNFSVSDIPVTAGVTKLHFHINPISYATSDATQLVAVISYD